MPFYFPFGQELKTVKQQPQSSNQAFVLGVYASAVHARWMGENGREKVKALAVASEPEIFWRGENAAEIIAGIELPKALGTLTVPSDPGLNGPSGRALDVSFLKPLKLKRQSTWLCDLLPESRVNEAQRRALEKHYTQDLIQNFGLQPATIPDFDKMELSNPARHEEILEELESSNAQLLILLGDLPVYYFLRHFDKKFKRLAQFGDTPEKYGREHEVKINQKNYHLIPLCHPRQARRLGSSNSKWGKLHDEWVRLSMQSQSA